MGIRLKGLDPSGPANEYLIRSNPPQVMTSEEVNIFLGVSNPTLCRLIREAGLPYVTMLGRRRFLKTAVLKWLEDNSEKKVAFCGKGNDEEFPAPPHDEEG